VMTFVNVPSAEGFDGAVVDLDGGRVCCSRCGVGVTRVESAEATGHLLLEYENRWYSRCAFCRTVVDFDKGRCPQSCDSCRGKMVEQAVESTKVCFHCSVPVGLSRRGGAQVLDVDGDTVYLCRLHRLRGSRRSYTVDELKMCLS
jgi:hypothetical protein